MGRVGAPAGRTSRQPEGLDRRSTASRVKSVGLGLFLLASIGFSSSLFASEEQQIEPLYSISISGPRVTLEAACDDPCHIEEVELVGNVAMKADKTESIAGHTEDEVSFDSECYGDCKKQKTQLRVSGPRKLREGVEVTIEEQWAHFVFYSVTDTDKGPATRRQHFEFRIDRPLIEVSLDDHQLQLTANVEQDEDVMRRKTLQR